MDDNNVSSTEDLNQVPPPLKLAKHVISTNEYKRTCLTEFLAPALAFDEDDREDILIVEEGVECILESVTE